MLIRVLNLSTLIASICLFLAFANAQNEKQTKRSALSRLNKCAIEFSGKNCNENDAQFLIDLYFRGEKDLLKPLLNAGLKSDGALTEILGTFYADILNTETKSFLFALSEKTKVEQIEISKRTVWADGSGNSIEWEARIKKKLTTIIRSNDKKLSPVAKVVAEQLEEFKKKKN